MKHTLIFTVLILMFNICLGQDYSFETKIFDCLVDMSNDLEIDFKKELLDFEEHLIKTGVLADNSGESYYKLYQMIKETGDIKFEYEYSLMDSLKSNMVLGNFNTDCLKSVEKKKNSRKYKRSKLYQLQLGMDSFKNSGNLNVSEIAGVILEVLEPKDFEHIYYKMTALVMLATTQDADIGLTPQLPPPGGENISISKRNLITVYVSTDNDSVILNDTKVSIDDLDDIVVKYIVSDSRDSLMPELVSKNIDLIGDCYQSQLIISVRNDRETIYRTYVKVQENLTSAYQKVRNDKAIDYFNLEFDELNYEQKKAIMELVPIRISEAEPLE